MGSSKKQTIGYKYYLSMHTILTHAKLDKIVGLFFDDKSAWSGDWSSGEITVSAESLFGGQEREGGVSGTIELLPGTPDQLQNSFLVDRLGALVPAFRGVTGLLFKDFYWGNNPYLKRWHVRGQRILTKDNGEEQWYVAKAAIASPGPVGGVVIAENFTEGLTPYSVASGSMDSFEIGSSPYGTCLVIEGSSGGIIQRDLSHVGGLQAVSFKFNPEVTGGDDFGCFTLWDGPAGYVFNLNAIRQADFDAARRPGIAATAVGAPEGPETFMGTEQLDIGVWYQFDAVYNATTLGYDCTITDLSSASVWGTVFAPCNPRPEATLLVFRKETAMGSAGRMKFADIEVRIISESGDFSDMNPAHMIRECLTNNDWGMGYDADEDVDDVSFTAAADALYAERMGMSLLWDRQIPIEDFVAEILRHIDAALFVASKGDAAGKFVLKLIRADYDIEDLIVLGPDDIIKFEGWKQTMPAEMANSITVNYWDPVRSNTGSVTLSDPALVIEQGSVINTTQRYEGFTNGTIAARVAERDMNALSRPLYVGTILAQWDPAADFEIGQAFVLNFPELEIYGLVMRVNGMTRGDGKTHNVRLTVSQDVYALPTTALVVPPDTDWTDPQQPPTPVVDQLVFELPYRELVQQVGQAQADDNLAPAPEAGYVAVAAGRPGSAMNAKANEDSGAGYEQFGVMDFCPTAKLAAPIGQTDTTVELSDGKELSLVVPGTYAIIGTEAVIVDSIVGTTLTFQRGTLDTVPALHLLGDLVFFCDEDYATSQTQYVSGETVNVKLQPVTGLGELDIGLADPVSVEMAQRAFRPYPPGNLLITDDLTTNAAYPAAAFGELEVSWAHRDRLLQSDQLIPATDGDIGPEPGVTYTVRYYLDDVLDETESAIAGTSATPYTLSGNGIARVEVEAVRDGLESWQAATAQFTYATSPNNTRIRVGGDRRIVVGGDVRTSRS